MEFSGPSVALGVFLTSQLGAAIWWASETDVRVTENRSAISRVTQNSQDIAVIQNDVKTIKQMLHENEKNIDEVAEMVRELLYSKSRDDK